MSYNNNNNNNNQQRFQNYSHLHHHHHNNNNNVETLRQFRDTHRRQREDAIQDEQDQRGLDFTTARNQNNNNNNSQHQRSFHDFGGNNNNNQIVRIGINIEHHAPFLPKPDNNNNNNTKGGEKNELVILDGGDDDEKNKHRALVWPAKDPNGQLATLALQGSATLREHRKKKIQKQTVRANVLTSSSFQQQNQEEDENNINKNQDDDDAATEVGNKTTVQREQQEQEDQLEEVDEGADEDFIPTIKTKKTETNNSNNKMNNNTKNSTSYYSASINDVIFDDEDPERVKIRRQRESLPAFKVKDQFVEMVRNNQVVVVKGETGSGKSTQLPSYLLEARFASKNPGEPGIIGCTQPRRVAAIGLARRVSQELNTEVGDLVGYAVRLEDETSDRTKLKFMTDGVLLREAVLDPLLWKYNVVVMDEAHERSIDTDVLLGVMKRVLKKRRDFKLVLMSATIQIEKFSDFFDGAPIFEVSGRTFPVTVNFSPNAVEDYVEAAVLQVMKIHVTSAAIEQKLRLMKKQKEENANNNNDDDNDDTQEEKSVNEQKKLQVEPAGDILVFMTGEEDVRCVCELIREKVATLESEIAHKTKLNEEIAKQTGIPAPPSLKLKKLDVIPCFSTILVNKEQLDRILNPPLDAENTRRCIVATNVAETSLTIDGITVVIDCGFMKCKVFKPRLGAHPLLPFPVSQAQATQRTGRAGRTREGTCYRLYTESAFQREMLDSPVPEIKRSSIDRVCLFVKAIGIKDVENFDFIDPPPTEIVHKSLYSLWLLGALDDTGALTEKGHQLAALPVEPAMGTVLLASREYRCSKECISIAAMLSVDTRALFAVPRDKEDEALRARDQYVDMKSDHLTLFNLMMAFLREAEMNGGESAARRWAEKTFLSFSVLKTASGIRDQLNEQVRKLLFNKNNNNNNNNTNNSITTNTNVTSSSSSSQHLLLPPVHPHNHRFASSTEAARFCVVSGFFPQSAQRKKLGEYVTILTRVTAQLPPTSALGSSTAEFVVYNELAMTTERSFLSVVSIADPTWLEETSRGLFFIRGKEAKALRQEDQQMLQEHQQRLLHQKQNHNGSFDNNNNNNNDNNNAPISRAEQTLKLAAALLNQRQQNQNTNVFQHQQQEFSQMNNNNNLHQNTNTSSTSTTTMLNEDDGFANDDRNDNNNVKNTNFTGSNNNNVNNDDDDAFAAAATAGISSTNVKTKPKFIPRCKR